MESVASHAATAAQASEDTAVETLGPEVPGYSKEAASQCNNVDDVLRHQRTGRFERDVAALREPLYRRAMRICKNHADAEDLVQDTMLKAYSSFHTFAPDTNLKAWLYRILTNTYISGYRRKQRQPVQYSIDAITDAELAAYARRTSTGQVSAEDEALAALPDTEVMAAMRSLPTQFRAVVYYADVAGFRYREIAEIMATPNGTVLSRLSRGRQHLRRALVDGASPELREGLPVSA